MSDDDTTRPLLDVHDLHVGFHTGHGMVEVLHGISLQLAPGETVAVVGQSGSGKSTLGASINRLLPSNGVISAGEIRLDGQEITALDERRMSHIRGASIGLVPQDPMTNLNPVMRIGAQVAETLTIHGRADRRSAREKAVALLQQAGIDDADARFEQFPHEFSGGMRQRVLIAIALACQPQLLIADEPTSALDVTVQQRVLDQLSTLTTDLGTAVLLITHDLAMAAERSDRILVMHDGVIVESGAPDRILQNPHDPYTKRLLAAAPGLHVDDRLPAARGATRGDRPEPMLRLENLTKRYQLRGSRSTITAVDDVSITVGAKETVAVVGESGSGKSTTARMALLLEPADLGDISYDDTPLGKATRADRTRFRRAVQPVFQNPFASLDPTYRIGRIIAEPLRVHRIGTKNDQREAVLSLLEKVALPSDVVDRYPNELSGGQQQRVAIARALALSPRLLVMDEAVSALDVLVQKQILDLMQDLQAQLGLSYLFITHDLSVVKMIADYVYVMRAGRTVESGRPEKIFQNPQDEYTARLIEAIPGRSLRPGPDPTATTALP